MVLQIRKTYMESLLNRGQNFAIKILNGWVFATVRDFEDANMYYTRYDGLATVASEASIAGGDAQDWNNWQTSQNESILFEEKERDKVLQAFIGIWPLRLRMWKRFPDPQSRGNLYNIKVSALNAVAPGSINGLQSPYHMPTEVSEMLIPIETEIRFGIFNPELYTIQPNFFIPIRRLQVHWLDPKNVIDAELMAKIISRRERCKFWSPGIEPWNWSSNDKISIEAIPELTPESLKEVLA